MNPPDDPEERTPPGGTDPRAVPGAASADVAWRAGVDRSLSELRQDQVECLAATIRLEARFGRLVLGITTLAVVAILPHLGPPSGWYAWLTAHPKEAFLGVAAALTLNSVMPRGPRPEGGIALAWWLLREWIAILDRRGWFGRFKVGIAEYDKPPPEDPPAPERKA